jgi:glycosyltransferase involved in cell wall biosynthesis
LMVVFRGVNLEFFNEKNTSEKKAIILAENWKIDRKNFIILLPGRLTRWKGQEVFIEALNFLIEDFKNKNFHAIILGSDQGRDVYSKKLLLLLERYRLRKKITFIENCKEMPLAYKISDLVISSSIEPEAFGRVSVEAQAMNKPIVASDIGGSRETVLNSKSGLLYKFNDPKELAKAINKIMKMDKQSLNLMGKLGRQNVEKKYNVDQMCQTTFTEYKKLLK